MRQQARYFLIFLFNVLYNLIPFFFFKKKYLLLFGMNLGSNTYVHSPVRFFYYRSGFVVGNNTTINPNSYVDNRGGVFIGDNVNISHDVKLYTGGHNIDSPKMDYISKKIVIHNNVWIFPNVIVMPGVVIEEGAVVFPGSVVTRNVRSYTVVAGVPAKFVRRRQNDIDYKLDHGKWFVF